MAHLYLIENWNIKLSINTAPGSTAVYSPLNVGIDNMQEALNEIVQQYHFFADEGFGRSRVTAEQPVWTFSGRRVWGDAAQDYIFAQKYALGDGRQTDAKVEYTANGYKYEITFDCAIANIQELGGATEENSAISFEIHVNGKPTLSKTAVSG